MKIFWRTDPILDTTEVINHPIWGDITYHSSSKRRRTRLAVVPFSGVALYLAKGQKPESTHTLIQHHEKWLQQALRRNAALEDKSIAFFQSHTSLPRKDVKTLIQAQLNALAMQYGFSYAKLTIRDQRSRWGSCSANDNISINQKLQFLPRELQDYILIHELAHTREKNHGPHFWKILYGIFGQEETRSRRNRLKEFEFLFHPPPA